MINGKRDFHIHATAHRLGNPRPDHTVAALLDRCDGLGLAVVGVLEHLNDSPKHPEECLRALVAEFREIPHPLECFVGAEVDICNSNGEVTCSPGLKAELGLDYLLGSVHLSSNDFPKIEDHIEEELRRHIAMMESCPHVEVCAHPWTSGKQWERNGLIPDWTYDYVPPAFQEALIGAALDHGKAIEVNISDRLDVGDGAYLDFVKRIVDSGVLISIGSDAHHLDVISRSLVVADLLDGLGVDDRQLWSPGDA